MEEFVKSIRPDNSPYDIFRERVMKECNVQRQTFYHWEKGRIVQRKFRPIINKIALEMFGRAVFGEGGGE